MKVNLNFEFYYPSTALQGMVIILTMDGYLIIQPFCLKYF